MPLLITRFQNWLYQICLARSMLYCCMLFLEVYCPVPAILNAQPQNWSSSVGEADYYRCDDGHEFETGEVERMMVCQTDGTWIPSDSCWSKLDTPDVVMA